MSTGKTILFEDFVPGAPIGDTEVVYSDELVQRWQRIFGAPADAAAGDAPDGAEAASMTIVMMMRAFLTVVAPRPPGNVHARQRLSLHALPRRGENIRTAVECVGKEIRRERRYVELRATGTGDAGRAIYTGTLSLVWAG